MATIQMFHFVWNGFDLFVHFLRVKLSYEEVYRTEIVPTAQMKARQKSNIYDFTKRISLFCILLC